MRTNYFVICLSITSDIGVQRNLLISYNDNVDSNNVFNKIKHNLNEFYYESSLNNFVNYLIEFYQVPHKR